jgi:hypothetical protein
MTKGEKMIWASAFVAELERRKRGGNQTQKKYGDWLEECSLLAVEHATDIVAMAQDHIGCALDKYGETSFEYIHLKEMLND